MNTQRITAQSKANIQAADRAELLTFDDKSAIKVFKDGRSSVVCGTREIMLYPTANDARRALKRLRPDLELTSFS